MKQKRKKGVMSSERDGDGDGGWTGDNTLMWESNQKKGKK